MAKKETAAEKIAGIEKDESFAPGHRACAGCIEALAVRHILKAAGKNTIAVSATGCMEVVSTPYPQTAWKIPWIHCAFENAAAVASGIDSALRVQGRRKETNLVVFGGDGASFDIGFGALSGAIERGQKFLYVATDNEAYANTGIQRSGATPFLASTTTSPGGKKVHGKQEPKKPLSLIVASHGIRYVATAAMGNHVDLNKKVKKALSTEGPSFIHVLAPCITGWKYDSELGIHLSRLAVQTGVHPLYEIENGVLRFTQKVQDRKPVSEYLDLQGRFRHLAPEEKKQVQAYVDARNEFLSSIEGKKCFDTLY